MMLMMFFYQMRIKFFKNAPADRPLFLLSMAGSAMAYFYRTEKMRASF